MRWLWHKLPDSSLIPRRVFALWLGLFSIAAMGGIYIVAAQALIPFYPYEVKRYVAIPDEGCPGALIGLKVERLLREPILGHLTHYELRTNWESVESGVMTQEEKFTGTYDGSELYGLQTLVSPALRSVPDRPGYWRLVSTYTLYGRVLGWPRSATETFVSPQIFRSLPGSDPTCKVSTPR